MLNAKPVAEITKIADSDRILFPKGDRSFRGIKILDLKRILAGPIAAHTLAEQGSDVLMIAFEHLPQIHEHVMDTIHGKWRKFINLKTNKGWEQLTTLVKGADVFAQGYRPVMLEGFGLGPEQPAAICLEIINLSISFFGSDGPLIHRACWE